MGAHCNAGGRAIPLYERLRAELGDPLPGFMARGPVHWEIANCLSMCGAGPNLIVYPDETEYHTLDRESLEQVIADYLTPDDAMES
jgi:(2Fe-2S) ferredoxin